MLDNETCRKLIQLYGTKELLWNSKSPWYHNKARREDAWNEICSEMGLPLAELKKKMTVLLSSYRRERWRIAKSQNAESGGGSIYVSKWFGFDDFSFMPERCTQNDPMDALDTTQDYILPDDNTDTLQEPTSDNEGEPPEETKEQNNTPKVPAKKPKKRKYVEEEREVIFPEPYTILTEDSRATDAYVSFGQHIANELRKYDNRTLIFVKQAINNIIFEADLGKFSNKKVLKRRKKLPCSPI